MAVRVKYKQGAFRAIRTSRETSAELDRRAQRVARVAGSGVEVESSISGGRGRARAEVVAVSFAARKRNARGNTLLRALDAARG